jgi:hypothetical protein
MKKTSITNWLQEQGFKRTTAGKQYGIRPRWVLDNVEVNADRHAIRVWVNAPDGKFGGAARKVTLFLNEWPLPVALAVAKAMIDTRAEKAVQS